MEERDFGFGRAKNKFFRAAFAPPRFLVLNHAEMHAT